MPAHVFVVIWIAVQSAAIGALDPCYESLLRNDDSAFDMIYRRIESNQNAHRFDELELGDNIVFPNMKFTCRGTVSGIRILAGLDPSTSRNWTETIGITISLWKADYGGILNLEPYWQGRVAADLLKLNSSHNIGLRRLSPGDNRLYFDPNTTGIVLYDFQVDVAMEVQPGVMIGLSLPDVPGTAVHVVYDTAAFTSNLDAETTCVHIRPSTLDSGQSLLSNSIFDFVPWQPILGVSFQRESGANGQVKSGIKGLEAVIIVLSILLLIAFILIAILIAVVINLRGKLKIFINFAQMSSRNPNSIGRALPIPMSSRRSTQASSTIYSELDDTALKRLSKTYDNAVCARNPFTSGASTLDIIDEFDDVFCSPADTEDDLYEQLSDRDIEHFTKSLIVLGDKVGEGEFGCVHRGKYKGLDSELAIKMSKDPQGNVPLLQEAVVLGQFRHPNIIQLFGLVTVADPIMLVMEYLPNGNLSEHLQQQTFYEGGGVQGFLQHVLLRFCIETCAGLSYLSKKGFIHRDLAARNVLLDRDYHCKVADFGMSRHLEENSYYITKGGRIPLKWTAPEAILYRKYSTKSDVWSYGMVMYEIWSLGRKPYEDLSPEEVMKVLNTGYCQPPPANCPREAYQLMVECWNPQYHNRPEFSTISTCLLNINLYQSIDSEGSGQSPLENGSETTLQYQDLQFRYTNNSNLTEALP